MEPYSQFDLNAALHAWRTQSGDDLSVEQLDELESHLLEAFTALQGNGLTKEEAFLIATRRLGRTDELGEEFRRNRLFAFSANRARWLLAGASGYIALYSLFGIVHNLVRSASFLLTHNTIALEASAITVVVVSLVAAAFLILDVAKGGPMLAWILNSRFLKSPARAAVMVALLIAANWATSLGAALTIKTFINSVSSAQVGSIFRTFTLLQHFTTAAVGMLAIVAVCLAGKLGEQRKAVL